MRTTHVVAAALAAMVGLGGALQVSARISGGKPAKSDCYVELDGVTQTKVHPNPIAECTDGDPTCDTDGACNQSCRFDVRVCIDQTDVPGCTPPTGGLRRLDIKSKGTKPEAPADLTGSACGAFVAIDVPLKTKNGGRKLVKNRQIITMIAKPQKGVKPPTDVDKITLTCLPKPGGCAATTTTTPTTEPTTSTAESTTSTSTTETSTSTTSTLP